MSRFSPHRLQEIPFGVQALVVIGVVLLGVALIQLGPSPVQVGARRETTGTAPRATYSPTSTTAALPTATMSRAADMETRPTNSPTVATLQPPKGGIIYALKPHVNRVGWVASDQEGNHFGESQLYTGMYDGQVYHGAFQFDLSFLMPGSTIHYAAVELTGLDEERLRQEADWSLQMLATQVDPDWPLHDFDTIHQAPTVYTLSPTLTTADLSTGQVYVFVLDEVQRAELEQRIARGVISFRLDGPSSGADNLFGWDSGYGSDSAKQGPTLRMAVSPPLVQVTSDVQRVTGLGTPTPTYVIVTSVPTPENVLTAAIRALTATAWATTVGTPTPLPMNWVTPIIVTATPTPADESTATAQAMYAQAVTLLTGTPTSTPGNVWTATPTPTYVILTPAPTPKNILTAAVHALTATAWAQATGTPTPMPPNWVTPIILTATPTPANGATAAIRAIEATAQVLLTGTPTPVPENVWVVTPTPTPFLIYLEDLPPVEPLPTLSEMPSALIGKIAFVSNRRGEDEFYVMNLDGSQIALLTNPWAYNYSLAVQDPASDGIGFVSRDGQYVIYDDGVVGQRQIWIKNADGTNPRNISQNGFDEYDPVWLVDPWPTATPTSTPTSTPTPGPTSPPPPPPTKPPPPL